MEYVSKLSEEEVRTICGLIPVSFFRESFKMEPQKFYQIWNVCRPEKVKEKDIEKIAAKYRQNPWIADVLNDGIQIQLDNVQLMISSFLQKNDNLHLALLHILPNSKFSDHIELYGKLTSRFYNDDYWDLIKSASKEFAALTSSNNELLKSINSSNIEDFQNQLDSAKAIWEADKTQYLSDIDILKKERDILKNTLEQKSQKLEDLQRLIEHTDPIAEISTDEELPYISLCRVGSPKGNGMELFRLADIVDNKLQSKYREDIPTRKNLYTTIKPPNTFGVWKWRPDYSSGRQDRCESDFLAELIPIEIILFPDCNSEDDLKQCLRKGIPREIKSGKVLFSFPSNGKYTGLLCTARDLEVRAGTTVLKPSKPVLPLYEISGGEIISLGDMQFFNQFHLGTPQKLLQIVDPFALIKDTILRRASVKKLMTWASGRDAREFKKFLEEIPTSEFYTEIAANCACSDEEAKVYVQQFLDRAESYFLQSDLDSEILSVALVRSPALLGKCQLLVEEQWKNEHAAQLADAEENLSRVTQAAEEQTNLYNHMAKKEKAAKDHLGSIEAMISEKEQLAADVEKKVSDRIEAARKNASDFICEMAFSGSNTFTSLKPENAFADFHPGTPLAENDIEQHTNWEELLCTLRDNLEVAGISQEHAQDFAAYLYAAYTAHIPLLLAGPNSHPIADAFSVSLFGKTASVLYIDNGSHSAFSKLRAESEEEVIIVPDLLSAGGINHVSELAAISGKYIIAVHPFAEDLTIEPKGLYNYVLPVLTELFVDNIPTGDFVGGHADAGFQEYSSTCGKKRIPLANHFSMSSLIKGRLRQILADTDALRKNEYADRDVLLTLFPYAYVTGSATDFWAELQKDNFLTKDTRTLLQVFMGEAE